MVAITPADAESMVSSMPCQPVLSGCLVVGLGKFFDCSRQQCDGLRKVLVALKGGLAGSSLGLSFCAFGRCGRV